MKKNLKTKVKLHRLLCLVILAGILCIGTYGAETSSSALKYELYTQGILDQSQLGYAENKEVTRMDMARIFVRLSGEEKNLEKVALPFEDVSGRDSLYAGYLYKRGYMKGISANQFGTDKPCGSRLYMHFLLQALGYSEGKEADYERANSLEFAEKIGLIRADEKNQLEQGTFTY